MSTRKRKTLHEPTAETRELVRKCAGYGLLQAQIAKLLPVRRDGTLCDDHTIREMYATEWREGRAQAEAQVARSLYMRACGTDDLGPPDWKAAAWWLERRGGQQWEPPEKRKRVEVGQAATFARLEQTELQDRISRLETVLRLAEQGPLIEGTAEEHDGHAKGAKQEQCT